MSTEPSTLEAFYSAIRAEAEDVVAQRSPQLMAVEVVAVDIKGFARIKPPGTTAAAATYWPALYVGTVPAVGEWVWALKVGRGYLILGRNKVQADETLSVLRADVDSHTTKLGNHDTTLNDHTTQLGKHSTRLGDHDTVLNNHGTRLNTVETDVSNHTTKLGNHDTTLTDHGNRLTPLETAKHTHNKAALSSWTAISLLNGWVNESTTTYYPGQSTLDPASGRIQLRGRIMNGTTDPGTVVGNIATGHRPGRAKSFVVRSSLHRINLAVKATGEIQILNSTAAGTVIDLDPIGYYKDQ